MLAEIDTGGHRVLHCDSRAVCPTTTPNHVSTITDERRTDLDRVSSTRKPRFDGSDVPAEPKRRSRKDRRRRPGICAERAGSLDCIRANSRADFDLPSLARVPRIDEDEESILDVSGAEFSTKNYVTEQPLHRERRENAFTCLVYRGSSRTIKDVSKERLSITRSCWESRQCNETAEQVRFTIAETSENFARHRSHQNQVCARSLWPSRCRSQDLDADGPTNHSGGTSTTTEESILLSSHHSRARSDRQFREDDRENYPEDIDGRNAVNADVRTDENVRSNYSRRRRNGGQEEVPIARIDQDDFADRRIKRGCRVRSFLQLAFLLFLVTFGRCGLLGSSSVFKFSARPTVSGLSVLGIGAIVGAVSAAPSDMIGDAGTRAERSANLSHITGASRKIQMYIKNRHLQILPDGTVNGSNDDTSDYSEYA